MIKKENITQEITIKHIFCDDCETEIKRTMQCEVAKCEICNKDLCNKCIGHEDDNGDYRIVYCKKCWQIGEKYRNLISTHESEIERLCQEWHDKCKIK